MFRLRILKCHACSSLVSCSMSTKLTYQINKALAITQASSIENIELNPSQMDKQGTLQPKVELKTSFDFVQRRVSKSSLEDYVKSTMAGTMPQILRRIMAKFDIHSDKELKSLSKELISQLDIAAVRLQMGCANNFHYLELLEAFGLRDDVDSWFKLSLLHSWMLLVRLNNSLEAAAFFRLRHALLVSFWSDVEARLKQVKKEINMKRSLNKELKILATLYYQAMYELDEGLLGDDTLLAFALWHNIYGRQEIDIVHLNNLVHYIRATIHYLDNMETDQLLKNELQWKPLKELYRE